MGNLAPLMTLLVPALTVIVIVLAYANRRPPPARKLGLPYSVNATVEGHGGIAELTVRDSKLCLAFLLASAGSYSPAMYHTIRVPLTRVRSVRLREIGIAIDYEGLEGPETLVVITREQGAKDRLLWELAVVVPEAVEAGIPAESPRSASAAAATALPPTGHAAPTGDTPDAARAVIDLDARMTSLGSALAGPADRSAPPPPRSGLGNGLFVAPPREGDE